jgi:hypothetical protein
MAQSIAQGSALRFDADARVTFGRGAALGSHTIEAWVRPSQQVTDTAIIAGHIGDPGAFCTQGFALVSDTANRLGYVVARSGCNDDPILYTPVGVDLGVWTHIAGTYEAGRMRLYVNGLLALELTGVAFNASTWMTAGAFDLATFPAAGRNHYIGDLDELRIWNYARTSAQILGTMFGTVSGDESGLVGAWNFDEGSGQTAFDRSVSARHGTLGVSATSSDVSDPTWITPGAPLQDDDDWPVCAPEGGFCAFTGAAVVRYGANGSFFFRTLTDGTACTNEVFGDPIFGTVKQCAINTPQPPEWTFCASEGGVCAFTGTTEVRYGANGSYVYKTVTDGTACTNEVFGDPIFGTVKTCDLPTVSGSPPQP